MVRRRSRRSSANGHGCTARINHPLGGVPKLTWLDCTMLIVDPSEFECVRLPKLVNSAEGHDFADLAHLPAFDATPQENVSPYTAKTLCPPCNIYAQFADIDIDVHPVFLTNRIRVWMVRQE